VTGNSALGAVGGLQAGYNWQFAPAWVAGVEGDISWTSLSDQRAAPALGPNGALAAANGTVTLNANTQWLASAREARVHGLVQQHYAVRHRWRRLGQY
jgi:outer membrane immunogenic protein